MWNRVILAALWLSLWTGISGCRSESHGPNLLKNGGFEEGHDGWTTLTTEAWVPHFDVSESVSHTGQRSALLRMRSDASTPSTRIWGVAQEIEAASFPQIVRGFYRVENWHRGTSKQYVQVVVIVFDADNGPERYPNYQIRYILAGIESPPFAIANARYIFTGASEPLASQWIPFQFDIARDFKTVWGAIPAGFSKIRVLFEVRFDDKAPDERPAADVYFDDLYVGPEPTPPSPSSSPEIP